MQKLFLYNGKFVSIAILRESFPSVIPMHGNLQDIKQVVKRRPS